MIISQRVRGVVWLSFQLWELVTPVQIWADPLFQRGKFTVTKYQGSEETIRLASSLESYSSHPIAKAISSLYRDKHKVEGFNDFPGEGVYGRVDGKEIIVGKREFVLKNCEGNADGDILICVNGKVEGSIWVEDKIRDDAKEVISKLKDMGKEVYIATGDPSSSAEEAEKELGVKVYKGLSPEDKVDIVKELRKRGVTVFIGDGVNDAEAIKEADIGIAISSGTEIAKYAGDIIIPSINSLLTVFRYGKRAVSKIKQNLIWAFAYNSVLVSIAAGVLYPIYLPPEYAALAMSMDSVSVVLWSMIR